MIVLDTHIWVWWVRCRVRLLLAALRCKLRLCVCELLRQLYTVASIRLFPESEI